MNKVQILIVEDEQPQGELLSSILQQAGYKTHWVSNAQDALLQLNSKPYHIVLSDWRLLDEDGLWLLEQVKKQHNQCYFILATAYGTIEHAVKAIQAGANDYLTKPFSRDSLLFTIERAAKHLSLQQENQSLQQQISERQQLVNMVGSSKPMQHIFNQVQKLAATQATVHISGESGTGKELAARALHQLSERSKQPFIAINCGAIPEGLAEAELFGAEKGAYTGADSIKVGNFEAANGGTIFLDEIAELPLVLQTKLLRVLQDNAVTRVGANKPLSINVRIISATHKNLAQLVKEGDFREDLFYRLNVVPIEMPPLRDRLADLAVLTRFFIQKHSKRHKLGDFSISSAAFDTLQAYHWPGNIRELGHCLERVMLLAENNTIEPQDLDFLINSSNKQNHFILPDGGIDWPTMEQSLYQQALEKTNNNKKQAANLLGLSYKSFLYRIEKFLISD